MCNEQRRRIALDQIRNDWSQTRIPLRFPEGLPNLAPLDSIRITDPNAIIRAAAPASSEAGADAPPEQQPESLQAGRPAAELTESTGSGRPDPAAAPPAAGSKEGPHESTTFMGEAELIIRRWSWPGPGGKPVYNFRSDGREFGNSARGGRCLIVADGFYEFTTPEVAPGQPKPKRKHKWLFTKPGEEWFCIAGLWRATAEVGEAYTMLTCPPGPDVAPYHGRQVVVLDRADWAAWLDDSNPAARFCRPLPAGTLAVEQVQ
ncbi:SOS response-associated peptidase family protein [Sphingomonas sp. LY54]|uniref:SOS response-associated peptidase family protein n=1 Tax=Sphingomonas sp. LY54 TaxID=3095343 RepID=UPI002D7777BF|nr:SOS response-associated peptidase family protein [Sphingomonas sp. LY54]WRP27187.1 SOS response-associated peptidase family protein [Sphingomonas sp. LY54]